MKGRMKMLQIGDRATVRTMESLIEEFGYNGYVGALCPLGFVEGMKCFSGKTVTITFVDEFGNVDFVPPEDDKNNESWYTYLWHESMFVKEEKHD